MIKPKIVTILGARPQFIKAAVVSPMLSEFAQEIIVHTGQHFDSNMSEVFFKELSLPEPRYHLNIHSGSHADMTGRMLMEIEKILLREKPDLALVYGDTNSTLAGALAAAKLDIPIAHIEAGVRSYNRKMPEEINRIVIDQLSSFYFVTSNSASENLKKEGCRNEYIYNVGDVMYDLVVKEMEATSNPFTHQVPLASIEHDVQRDYILVTLHRSENTDDPVKLKNLKNLIERISFIKPVLWIMHPRTKKALEKFNISVTNHASTEIDSSQSKGIKQKLTIIDPVGYKEMMFFVKNAFAVATDSGGLQKEAFYFKKPCVTLRSETEWIELNDLSWNLVLSDPINDTEQKLNAILEFLGKDFSTLPHKDIYGDGSAAQKIGAILKHLLSNR